MHDDARLTKTECKAGWDFCFEYDLFLDKGGETHGCDCAGYTPEAMAAKTKEAERSAFSNMVAKMLIVCG